MIPIRRSEIHRYLGYAGKTPDEETDAMIERLIPRLEEAVSPAYIYKTFPLSWDNDIPVLESVPLQSRNLSRNLKGCLKVSVFACTLGIGADRLIRRTELKSMAEASVLQAIAAAMAEEVCDEVNRTIAQEAKEAGLYVRPRYSPGYGDLSLETQKLVFSLLHPEKAIGVTLTDALLMVPSKSVTALIGLSETEEPCILQGCEECSIHETCVYSRTGGEE